MSVLLKLWSMIMAIIPSWILTTPLFLFLKTKQKQVHKQAFVNMLSSAFKVDDIVDGDGELPKGLRHESMPRHLGVILDGNRRWAKKRGLVPVDGYEAGLATIGEFFTLCQRCHELAKPEEVDYLLDLFEGSLKYYLSRYCRRYGRQVSVIEDTSTLHNSLQKAIEDIEEETKDNSGMHLVLAMSYSGQYDIVHACQTIATKVKDSLLQPEDITKSLFEQHLQTKVTDVPAPDLLIRTSGEIRISTYYLWQSAYSEMYFTDTLWPDFGEDQLVKALRAYQQRGRRFGRA